MIRNFATSINTSDSIVIRTVLSNKINTMCIYRKIKNQKIRKEQNANLRSRKNIVLKIKEIARIGNKNPLNRYNADRAES